MNCLKQLFFVNAAAGLLIFFSGCVPSHRVGLTDTGAPRYNKVLVTYLIGGSHGGLTRDPSQAAGPASTVSDSTIESGADWSIAALKIEYPHPEGDADLARATLRLSRGPAIPKSKTLAQKFHSSLDWLSWRDSQPDSVRQAHDELWVLDFPRQQLDLMLVDLANSGFFEDQQRPEGGTQLSVTIDWGRTAKPWSTDARLDGIVERIQREGWLVGFALPDNKPTGSGFTRIAKTE